MVIFLLALIGTIIVMAILSIGRLGFGRREKFERRRFLTWFAWFFVLNYVFCLAILYLSEPAFTGPFGGWQWLLWPLALSSIANLFAFARPVMGVLEEASAVSQGRPRSMRGAQTQVPGNASRGAIAAGIFGLVVVAVIGIVVSGLIVVFTTWFDSNAKALAAVPNVHIESSHTLPPTDPKNIVLVSPSIASYKGQQVIGSNGQNLGSAYNIDSSSYTLQSIDHHLYYVGPLSYNNIFANFASATTPGYVVVDAENPQAVPQLYTGSSDSLAYLPGAIFNQDLLRHVYLSGYTYGKLVDPTLELDDNFHPYWTISLMQPSRGYTGDVLSQVLIVNAHTGAISVYKPQDVPAWVDRVIPAAIVSQYLGWWGLYHAAPWFDPSGAGQQTPGSDPQLLYNTVDKPVWIIPMTSASSQDQSSTGVFLFDTHANQGYFYPLGGLGIGNNVQSTFQSTSKNIRNYEVASTQLYSIYGTPTWVAIYVQSAGDGGFQSVGVVDAHNLNGSNVQYEASLPQALQDYQQWLTLQGSGGGSPGGGPTVVSVSGKVLRISPVQQGNSTVYYIQLAGQGEIFTANLSLSPKLPLVQPGDVVRVQYTSTGGTVINLSGFDDASINLGASATPIATKPALTGTPSPTPKP